MNTSKEWADATFERATWWNLHPDRIPKDYGEPSEYTVPGPIGDELDLIEGWEELQINPIY